MWSPQCTADAVLRPTVFRQRSSQQRVCRRPTAAPLTSSNSRPIRSTAASRRLLTVDLCFWPRPMLGLSEIPRALSMSEIVVHMTRLCSCLWNSKSPSEYQACPNGEHKAFKVVKEEETPFSMSAMSLQLKSCATFVFPAASLATPGLVFNRYPLCPNQPSG